MTEEILIEETIDGYAEEVSEEVTEPEIVEELLDLPEPEPSRYPLHTDIADFDENGNCMLNIDFKDFDVSFDIYFNGDENLTAEEYEKVYQEVALACNESGGYTIDCFKDRYTVRKIDEIGQIHYEAMTEEEKAEYNKQKHIRELEEELTSAQKQLADMDYIGTKIATGRATVEQYADKIQLMNELAARVDEIREELAEHGKTAGDDETSSV